MRRILAAAFLFAALANCSGGKQPTADRQGGNMDSPAAKLSITSDAFKDGQPIPKLYSCDGANHSPSIHWSNPPAGTKSFALVIDDPDAPGGTFHHWGVYDIPASTRGIAEGEHIGSEVRNDKGTPGYTGPCPPPGNGLHHYHFKLFALGTDKLGLKTDAKIVDVENAAAPKALAKGELIGTYERK
jgi:Raf kinase inhibitor-like YbhB/YbcL family protein